MILPLWVGESCPLPAPPTTWETRMTPGPPQHTSHAIAFHHRVTLTLGIHHLPEMAQHFLGAAGCCHVADAVGIHQLQWKIVYNIQGLFSPFCGRHFAFNSCVRLCQQAAFTKAVFLHTSWPKSLWVSSLHTPGVPSLTQCIPYSFVGHLLHKIDG